MTRTLSLAMLLPALLPLAACTDGGGINLFTVDDDIELGQQLRDEILADPDTYPIADESEFADAYEHLYRIRDEILDTGDVVYADDFEWEIYLIDDPDTLNAFAAPGGYIWVYSGLMAFLETEDAFAGVMGHELAHADRRHSTQQLTKLYGIETLLSLLLGEDPGLVAEIAAALVSMQFSRTHEAESDMYSVDYLCDTDYAANGAADFFAALEGFEVPEFLSTHPSSDSRIEDITAQAEEWGCSLEYSDADWEAVLESLPQ